MRWAMSQTDVEARDAYRIECDMRHEQRYEQNLRVSTLESTPITGQPPSMSQYRQNKLKQGAAEILRVLMNDDDFIPM
jgi:hypothetical protein